MSLPVPRPGLVIRYSFLWSREQASGATEGAKDGPCAPALCPSLVPLSSRHAAVRMAISRRSSRPSPIGRPTIPPRPTKLDSAHGPGASFRVTRGKAHDDEIGSGGRIRTDDRSVNSRLLYR